MKIVFAEEFRRQFQKLPQDIQKLYHKQEKIFRQDWRDARLHIKKLTDHPFPFSFRITRRYRVLFAFIYLDTALFATVGHRRDSYRR